MEIALMLFHFLRQVKNYIPAGRSKQLGRCDQHLTPLGISTAGKGVRAEAEEGSDRVWIWIVKKRRGNAIECDVY